MRLQDHPMYNYCDFYSTRTYKSCYNLNSRNLKLALQIAAKQLFV